jgi:hypothetical protein
VARTNGRVEKLLVIYVEYYSVWYMRTKREYLQQEMMLLPPMETHIPEDHLLFRLNRILDLGFVHDEVRDRYCQDNVRATRPRAGLGQTSRGYHQITSLLSP